MVHSTDLPLDDTPQKRSSKLGRGDSAQLRQWRPKVRRQASRDGRSIRSWSNGDVVSSGSKNPWRAIFGFFC